MILSIRKFEYEELKSQLQPDDTVVVLSCNNCAKKCVGLGGRAGLKALSDKLEGDGFTVKRFFDAYYAEGVIPTVLARWAMTGEKDPILDLGRR